MTGIIHSMTSDEQQFIRTYIEERQKCKQNNHYKIIFLKKG